MFFRRKFNREKFAESIPRFGQHSNSNSFYSKNKALFERNIAVIVAIAVLAFIITLVCFLGQDLIWIQFIPNTKAKMQIISEIPFEYVSQIKTKDLKEQRRMLVAPVYKIEMSAYDKFEHAINRLDELLDAFSNQDPSNEAHLLELKKFIRNFNEKYEKDINWSDVVTLLQSADEYDRTRVFIEGLSIVKNISEEGIFDQNLIDKKSEEYFLNIEIEGALNRGRSRMKDEADRHLKLCLFAIEAPADVLQAAYRILAKGIEYNVVFDNPATSQKIMRTLQETQSVIVKIPIDTVLIEAGSLITAEDYERLQAYRENLRGTHISLAHASNNNLMERFLISFLILLLVYLFFCTSRGDLKALTRKEFSLVATLLFLNLLIFRFIIFIFELQIFMKALAAIWLQEGGEPHVPILNPVYLLPYLMPLTFSCLLGTLLLRTYIGVLLGIVSSIFCCLMLSQSVEFLVVSFFIVFVSVYFVRHSHIRMQVIRSGIFGGLVFALSAIGFSFSGHSLQKIHALEALLGFSNGVFVSMIILIILPFFENTFRCCTNIRLIELTDYRNPLLTKLQILAPGTYHHSLMVANLAEQAAISIRANPFLCRTLALYHDVGKLIKPEYFTENQGDNKNPHEKKTPFISALIIKSHVKEGVAMAKAEGIPPRIIDGITEHHGTSIIRYFYSKALKQQEEIRLSGDPSAPKGEIEKSAFKYDGPRPRSKETLILSLADSIEAASRSLYNPTPQSIETLIDNVIEGKVKEHQFDECLITFHDLAALRNSFHFILLNMLHSRINYDEVKI
ncbi:MAG: HDIG domain-containing protein [Puniceicoccales bacterium]|jgi:putative nucleotidyltransferase with HDIG domain|nr:HDIG domain-containing protein [Puniceicoccales bacterium]